MISDELGPTNADLLQAMVALHSFGEAGLQRLDVRIDRLDTKIETLRYDMNVRFDRVYVDSDELKFRVARLEHDRT